MVSEETIKIVLRGAGKDCPDPLSVGVHKGAQGRRHAVKIGSGCQMLNFVAEQQDGASGLQKAVQSFVCGLNSRLRILSELGLHQPVSCAIPTA